MGGLVEDCALVGLRAVGGGPARAADRVNDCKKRPISIVGLLKKEQ